MTINVTIPPVEIQTRPRITVFGVGGAGGNAVNNMIKASLEGVEFVVANTDAQALQGSLSTKRLQLGTTITRGLGAGARPDVGRASAEEQLEDILGYLNGTNMCFITAGMGGGTGTGAAPVIARAAREQGILTVGVVTKPFHFEGAHRMRVAESGINELAEFVDTLIIIPNQNLFRIANEKTTFADAFKMADDVLHAGVRGVTDLMVMPGLINLDFADIRTVMTEMGKAMMGTGEATGDRRAVDAAEAAISNPLLDDVSMKGARGVLINITGGMDMTLFEVDEAANRIRDEVDPEANIIFGSTFDQSMEGKMRVSVVATGIESAAAVKPAPSPQLSLVHDRARRPVPAAPVPGSMLREPPAAPRTTGGPDYHASLTPAAMPVAAAPAQQQAAAPQPQGQFIAHAARHIDEALATPPLDEPVTPAAPPPAMVATRGERRDGAFIAPRPADAGPRLGPPLPESFSAPSGAPAGDKGRRPTLFQRVTGGLFGGGSDAGRGASAAPVTAPPATMPGFNTQRAPAPQPTAPAAAPATAAAPAPRMEAAEKPKLPPAEDDVLDIPAFLRRQAN
jgi:cell division protein FtsZ